MKTKTTTSDLELHEASILVGERGHRMLCLTGTLDRKPVTIATMAGYSPEEMAAAMRFIAQKLEAFIVPHSTH